MRYDPDKHHRRSIRLAEYDYSQVGAYFITVCAHDRRCLFGDIVDGEMRLNVYGKTVRQTWDGLPGHYPHVELDAFVIMPNHIHGVIELTVGVGAGLKPAPTGPVPIISVTTKPVPTISTPTIVRHGLPEIVRAFKTFSARQINAMLGTPGIAVWQRNYYEHIIRDEAEWDRIREYIETNPARWADDKENPDATNQ